jgi:hypothetical protein
MLPRYKINFEFFYDFFGIGATIVMHGKEVINTEFMRRTLNSSLRRKFSFNKNIHLLPDENIMVFISNEIDDL